MKTSSKTILLVEDEAIIALAEAHNLEQVGYTVIRAASGESALEMLKDGGIPEIDLILMDIDLGQGMDGTEAAREILKHHDIPIVFLSAHMEPDIVRKTEEITNYGYVVKSSVFTVLDASIKMAFKLFRAMRQLDLDSMELESTNKRLQASLAENRKAFDDLEHQKTMRDKIFQLSPNAVCVTRLSDGIYLDVNQSWCDLFGFTREETIGHSSFSRELDIWDHPEYREAIIARYRKGKGPISFEADYRHKVGSIISASTTSDIVEIDGVEYVISSIRDLTANQRQERELQESEDRYRLLFEEAGAGILIYDRDLRILGANKKSIDMFGYSKEEMLSISLRQLDPDLSDPTILQERSEGIFEKGPYRFMAKRQLKDGLVQPVEVNAMPILWLGKVAVMAIVHDVAERIENENKLAESKGILRAALQSPSDVLMVGIDKDFTCLYVNRSYRDLKANRLGLDIKAGDRLTDNLPHDTFFERALPYFQKALSGESVRVVEEYQDHAVTFDAIFNPILGRSGEILGASLFSIDISERVAVEKRLRERESQLEAIGDNVPAMLAILDANTLRYQYVNDWYKRSYGLSMEQILGKTIGDIGGEENYRNASKYLAEAFNGRRTTYEREFTLAQGNVWGRVDYVPLFGGHGEVEQILILGVDITELKRTTEALGKSEKEVRELLRQKELMLREVHHRIKNNLAILSSLLSIRIDDSGDTPTNSILHEAVSEIDSMGLLYDQLYRSEYTGSMSIREYFSQMLAQTTKVFERTKTVTTRVEIGDFTLEADRLSRLGIVINELMTNSIKYAFADVADPTITLRAELQDKQLLIEYEDNGRGLPDGFSIDNSGGFGMQLIQAMLHRVGGTIRAETGRGASFNISLPV